MAVVEVEGLNDLRKDLRALDSKLPAVLTAANKRAAEIVASRARQLLGAGPGQAPKTAASIKVLGGAGYASIKLGGDKYPTAMGDNFGAIKYKQFRAWRHGEDYGLFEAVGQTREPMMAAYTQAIDEIIKANFRL